MKSQIEISYATIDAGSDSGLYEVTYGDSVGRAEAYRWVTAPPTVIREHLKPGMILSARDKPYRVIGFGIVQEDGSILSRAGENWLSNGKKYPENETNFVEGFLLKNIGATGPWGAEKPLFSPKINNRYWSKQWYACTPSNPIGLNTLSRMYNYVFDSNLLTSRIVSDVLMAAVKSYSKEFKSSSDLVDREMKQELITADQVSNILNAYAEGEMDYETFLEISKNAQEHSQNNPTYHVFSLRSIDGLMRSVEGDLDTWATYMDDKFNGGSSYEGRKIILKIMKDDIGLNNLLYRAAIYSMMQDTENSEY